MFNSVKILLLTILTLCVVSCSATRSVQYGQPVLPVSQVQPEPSSGNDFLWGAWEGTISADRSSVELIPSRNGAWPNHYNVLRWLEYGPCYDCVQIVDKQIIDANRVNLTIQIHHPFPGLPQFTGFDVFGGIQFPGNRLITDDWPFGSGEIDLAWRFDNAAQVLNPHGYMKGFNVEKTPPYKGFIPGKLGGEIVDPQMDQEALIWPYRIFRTTPERNMFEVWQTASQTYELWLPEGEEVKFGYVVVSKWVPPDTMPVTDPATQFPREANLGIYAFEVLETTGPASYTQDATVRFKVYYHSVIDLDDNANIKFDYLQEGIWQYFNNGGIQWKNTETVSESGWEGVDEYIMTFERTPEGPDKGPPGLYPYAIYPRLYTKLYWIVPKIAWFVFEIECED